MALFHMQPRWAWAWGGIATGGGGAGILAYYQRFCEGMGRVNGFMGPEHFGNQSALLCLLSLVALLWGAAVARSRLLVAVSILGVIGGGVGAIFSGTRAAWLSLVIILPIILLFAVRLRLYKTVFSILVGVAILTSLLLSSPEYGVQQRVKTATDEVVSYFAGEVRGSAGLRLELWRSGQILFIERPLLGYGENQYAERMQVLADNGVINHQVSRFNHFHNDWMNAVAKGGSIGFLVLLGVYLMPLVLALVTILKYRVTDVTLLAVGCVVLVGNFMVYGLLHNALGANNGVMTYAFWLVLLVSAFTVKASQAASISVSSNSSG
jgi:O-antigen ligase